MNLILYAIPLFITLIIIELIVDHVRGTGYYRLNDAVTSLNAGILSRVTVILWKLAPVVVYIFAYQNFALFEVPLNPLTWILAFVFYVYPIIGITASAMNETYFGPHTWYITRVKNTI